MIPVESYKHNPGNYVTVKGPDGKMYKMLGEVARKRGLIGKKLSKKERVKRTRANRGFKTKKELEISEAEKV